MPDVRIEGGVIRVGAQRVPLIAGEVHYWRLNPARWPHVLAAARRLGLRMLATYVPWEYHELAPGRFDFHGTSEPPRDLVGFLELLQHEGFWIFIRPGPYIYAEWPNAGVPDRVVTLPRLGAAYRREAAVWMRAVTDVLRPYLATRGGRIVLWQPDNEMDLFSHWFEDPCGLSGRQAGFFQEFLRSAYGDVAALNAAWGTACARLEDAQPLAERPNAFDAGALTRHKDYWRFQHWGTAEALRWHADEYRALGVDVPLVANFYPGGDVQNWREVAKVVDLCGIDWYPQNEFGAGPGPAPTGGEHRRFLDTCRYQRAFSPLPHLAEFECGVWHGFHDYVGVLTPNHYRLTAFSALLAGVQGFNWYMLAERDNWYYCPINARGDPRPELAEVFMGIHRVVQACDPPTLTKLTQTAVVLEPVHIGTDRIMADNPVLDALYAADIDHEIYDPELGARSAGLMLYASADWLPRAAQERLVHWIADGGTLVVFQGRFPQRDEHFRPYNGLGVAPPDRILSRLGKQVSVAIGAHAGIAEGAVWVWDDPPGTPLVGTQVAGRQQAVENADKWMTSCIGRQWPCGYVEPRGCGRLVVLGLPPSPSLLRALHRGLGFPLYAQAELSGVQTAVFERAGEYFLFAVNMNNADVRTRVALDGVPVGTGLVVLDLWTEQRESQAADALTILVPRRSGGAWCVRSA